MNTAINKASCALPDRVKLSFVIFDIWAERQSARMSKITNDGLTRSGAGCFIAVAIMTTVGIKGLFIVTRNFSSLLDKGLGTQT